MMSVTQLEKHTEKLELELANARKSQGTFEDALKYKNNLVNQLKAQVSEYQVVADVKQSLQQKQEKLCEAVGNGDAMEVTDNFLGILVEFTRTWDKHELLQEIDSTRRSKFYVTLSLQTVGVLTYTFGNLKFCVILPIFQS